MFGEGPLEQIQHRIHLAWCYRFGAVFGGVGRCRKDPGVVARGVAVPSQPGGNFGAPVIDRLTDPVGASAVARHVDHFSSHSPMP